MLYTQNIIQQTVGVNSPVNLGVAQIKTCNSGISYNNNSTQFSLSCPGYYTIQYSISGTSAGAPISFELRNNGVTIPGSAVQFTAPAGNFTASNFGAIKVLPSCGCVTNTSTITLVNTQTASVTLTNVNVEEVKHN